MSKKIKVKDDILNKEIDFSGKLAKDTSFEVLFDDYGDELIFFS